MPTFNSDIAAKQVNPTIGNRAPGNKATLTLMWLVAKYTTVGTEVTADRIRIGNIPAGCIPLPHLGRVATDGLGGTAPTVQFGTLGTAGAYSAATSTLVSATNLALTPVTTQVTGAAAVAEGDEMVYGTLAAVTGTLTAAKTLTVYIPYLALV
jgi:hypothetical protein